MNKDYFVHESSLVDEGAIVGKNTKIWHFSHIMNNSIIGENCNIGQNVNIAPNVKIGNNVKIQNNVSVYSGVEVEDYVFLGPSCVFTNDLNPRCEFPKEKSAYIKTVVKRGASIGANSTIVCGVEIGEYAMVGAGAVVTKDVPKHSLVIGNPARHHAYVCCCGNKLNSSLKCEKCNKEYSMSINGLEDKKIQFRDLKAQYMSLKSSIDNALAKALQSSNFILGQEVSILEKQLSEFVGVKHCVTCANGTDALILSCMAYNIGEGDLVFAPDFTYFATVNSAMLRGASIALVDIDKNTFNICPLSLRKTIQKYKDHPTLKPKAIISVDLFGQCADYKEIEKIAKEYNLIIIEDAAQGFGSSIDGKRACSFGDIATTSFFPAKPLGCYGDGGAIFTNDSEIDKKLRSLRCQGRSDVDKYDNRTLGLNSRLDTIQAAILIEKLKAFEGYELKAVNDCADYYTSHLKDIVVTPRIKEGFYSSWAQYTILLQSREQRDLLKEYLSSKNIPSMIYYPKQMHKQTAIENLGYNDGDFTNTDFVVDRCLSLPMHPYLTKDQQDIVISAVKDCLSGRK